jgi:hypothetical protein
LALAVCKSRRKCVVRQVDGSRSRLINGNLSNKSIPYGAKGVQVEESKKGYTGDALALRGDERRDKLR